MRQLSMLKDFRVKLTKMFEYSNSENLLGLYFSVICSYIWIYSDISEYICLYRNFTNVTQWFDCDSSEKLSRIVFLYSRTFRKINEWCPKHHTSFQIGEGSLFFYRSPNNPVSAWLVIYYGWEQIKGLVSNNIKLHFEKGLWKQLVVNGIFWERAFSKLNDTWNIMGITIEEF